MSGHAALGRLHGMATTVRRSGPGRNVARTAGFNVASTAAAGLGGIILARAFGPTVRGEYAAVTAWFGMALLVGGMGQPAALCFYVARDPERAREYVATSRAMMLTTGIVAVAAGVMLSPLLADGHPGLSVSYQIAFCCSIVAFVAASYTYALQARDLRRWNVVRVSQPALSVVGIIVLWRLRLLTLPNAMILLAATMLIQLGWAYLSCRRTSLAPGRARKGLVRPLAGYGAAQIAAMTPAALNAQLDQLVLSQTVPPADLGRYAVAVSLTLLPIPLVSAIGNVAFPRLAAQRVQSAASHRLQRLAVLSSATLAAGILVPLALVAYWLVPLVFGASYRGAVPLLWILTPGSVFLACSQVVGDLLRGRNQPIIVAWAQGLAMVFTFALLFALLPFLGVYAAAIASTVAYGVALAVMLRCLWRPPRSAGTRRRKRAALGQLLRGQRNRRPLSPHCGAVLSTDLTAGSRNVGASAFCTPRRCQLLSCRMLEPGPLPPGYISQGLRGEAGMQMTIKNLVRPIPGVRRLSLIRQRLGFNGSASYWERNYKYGGTSGGGSYGALARGKADFLNTFVREHDVQSVIEFGCGDGHQLSLADYPRYIGLDVSRTALGLCNRSFADDPTKSFYLYDGACFIDRAALFTADLAISLDVIYHLVENRVFEAYMEHIFSASRRYVVLYTTNKMMADTAPHVRHRLVTPWVEENYPQWVLEKTASGPASGPNRADFFVYERLSA